GTARAAGDPVSPNAQITVAVLKRSPTTYPAFSPADSWSYTLLEADPGHTNWADFPTAGFNASWIVVSANMYKTNCGICTNSSDFLYTKVWVFNKTNLYAGGHSVTPLADTNVPPARGLAPSLV